MNIRFGYELVFDCPQPTPMILMLHAHPGRIHDLLRPDDMRTDPHVPISIYHDGFGNTCTRIEAPRGEIRISTDGLINDDGLSEPAYPFAKEHPVSLLPEDTLLYLLDSRHCKADRLMTDAWRRFGRYRPGWSRVEAICDFVHLLSPRAHPGTHWLNGAWQTSTDEQSVAREFVHMAITLCRCLNIPARYCTGYLGDIATPPGAAAVASPRDFTAWFEAYLGGSWHTFDPRNRQRRIGRILIARGRDAADVAVCTAFGPNSLVDYRIWTEEVAPTVRAESSASAYLDERYGQAY